MVYISMKKKSRYEKFITTMLIIICSLLIYDIVAISIFFGINKVASIPYTTEEWQQARDILEAEYSKHAQYKSKDEYTSLIKKQINAKLYICVESDIMYNLTSDDGDAFINLRLIMIHTKLTLSSYCYVLAHELLHIKTFTKNERYIDFQTFKYLYYNEDPGLHQTGADLALYHIYKYKDAEYLCDDLIIHNLLYENV